MNRLLATACALAIASLTVACSQQGGGGAGKSDNVAVVDGVAIKRTTYMEYVKSVTKTPWENISVKDRNALLANLISAVLLTRQAETSGLTSQEATRAALELSRMSVLSQFVTEDYKAAHKVTQEELRAEYDAQVAALDKKQYRASHILLRSDEEARQVIAQLKGGGNFAEIARKQSIDAGSRDKGGDMDWISPSTLDQAFAEGIGKLKKGETSTVPVATMFGWHVIRVADIRDNVPPSFDSAKGRLEEIIYSKKVNAYVEGLVAKAKITKSL